MARPQRSHLATAGAVTRNRVISDFLRMDPHLGKCPPSVSCEGSLALRRSDWHTPLARPVRRPEPLKTSPMRHREGDTATLKSAAAGTHRSAQPLFSAARPGGVEARGDHRTVPHREAKRAPGNALCPRGIGSDLPLNPLGRSRCRYPRKSPDPSREG